MPRYQRKPKPKAFDTRYDRPKQKVHQSHECKVCGSHLACYSYDFGRTWYCVDHKEAGKP